MCGPSHLPRGTLLACCSFFTVVGFLLILAGFLAPGWYYRQTPTQDDHLGVYYAVVCGNSVCTSGSILNPTDRIREMQIEATIAFVLAIIATFLVLWLRKPSETIMKGCALIVCLIAGVLGIVAAARFGQYIIDNDDGSQRFPYALFMFGLGSIILVLVAFAIGFDIWRGSLTPWDYNQRYPPKQDYVAEPYRSHSYYDGPEYDRGDYPYRSYRDDRPYYTEEKKFYPEDRRDRYPPYEHRRYADDRPSYVIEEKREILPPIGGEYVKVLPPLEPSYVAYDRPSRPYSITREYIPRDYSRHSRYVRSRDYDDDGPYVVSVGY